MTYFDDNELDWWSKYWASIESEKGEKKTLENGVLPHDVDRFVPSRLMQMQALKMDKSYGRHNAVCCALPLFVLLLSVQANRKSPRHVVPPSKTSKLKIYDNELEENFGDFQVHIVFSHTITRKPLGHPQNV